MTDKKSGSLEEHLRLGVDAARTGNDKAAKAHLIAVLKQDPENIPAMLWLAFVLPSPEDTIRVLNRVLSLDPSNERARAGIRWAKGRLGLDPDAPTAEKDAAVAGVVSAQSKSVADTADDASIRQQLLSGKVQKQAKKGVLAHRARRTIRPLLVIILLTGVLGFAAIGLGLLALIPPETLAAWLPTSAQAGPPPAVVATEPVPPSAQTVQKPEFYSYAVQSDTLSLKLPSAVEVASAPTVLAESSQPAPSSGLIPLASSAFPALNPAVFLGPQLPENDPNFELPVDRLLLAHQPASPNEKWIEVNLSAQQVIAWEGDKPVFSFKASTGLPNTPTVTGEYHIYWKLEKTLMTGPNYYLPDVPYTMYFYGGYGLHGTYWHNNFGQPMSHGCVNLETGNAQKLFEWAEPVMPPGQTQVTASADNPGTLVVVHQ